ncbi:MAG TPA: hypothetical protein VF517_06895 [Thermoleophilaceae bacterium]|jgi:acyl dehydratase
MLVVERALIDSRASGLAVLLSHVADLRELRDVVFERPVAPGDTLRLSVKVGSAEPLADDGELLTTSWKVLNGAGETVVRAHVDVVCRGPWKDAAATTAAALDDVDIGQIPV